MNLYNENDIPKHLQQYFEPVEIGMEETPGEFIDALLLVFREAKRVLRSDGTCWVNLGDSYAGSGKSGCTEEARRNHIQFGKKETESRQVSPTKTGPIYPAGHIPIATGYQSTGTLKGKDLIGTPWMLAFAMRDDGWYLRSDIIWKKPSPAPESTKDRCTRAHEHIFMFAKSKQYFYDMESLRSDTGANMRDVWTIGVEQNKLEHYASYPTEIPRKIIKVSTSYHGVCSNCGKPFIREKVQLNKWKQNCSCNSEVAASIVLDPFGGSCTTGIVAAELGRSAIMIDIKEEYLKMGYDRLKHAGYEKLLQSIVYINE